MPSMTLKNAWCTVLRFCNAGASTAEILLFMPEVCSTLPDLARQMVSLPGLCCARAALSNAAWVLSAHAKPPGLICSSRATGA